MICFSGGDHKYRMDDDVKYSAIFEWDMSVEESETYKLAVIYEEEFLKMFRGTPEMDGLSYRKNSIPKAKDPRKSNLFRYCWKLRRETRGLIDPQDYRHYIRANLTVCQLQRSHQRQKDGFTKAATHIEPN